METAFRIWHGINLEKARGTSLLSLNINALWNLLNIPFSGYNTMYYYVKSACKVNRHSLRKCVPETVVRRGIYSGKLPVRTTKRRLGNTGGRNAISLHLLPKRACVSCRGLAKWELPKSSENWRRQSVVCYCLLVWHLCRLLVRAIVCIIIFRLLSDC